MAVIRITPLTTLTLTTELHLVLCDDDHPLSPTAARAACAAVATAAATSPSSSAAPLELIVHGVVANRRSMGGVVFIDLTIPDATATRSALQVVVCPNDLTDGLRGLALQLALRRQSAIRVAGLAGSSRSGEPSLLARSLRLLGLPPDPAALLKTARLLASTSDLPAEEAAEALGCSLEALYELVHSIEAADGAEDSSNAEATAHARALAATLRKWRQQQQQQQGGAGASLLLLRGRRERPPRFSPAELTLLRELSSRHTEWALEHITCLAPLREVAGALSGPLAPERGLPEGLGEAEREVRLAYYREKKVPQLRWMLRQARELVEARLSARAAAAAAVVTMGGGERSGSAERTPLRVVDLGCGKGDFSLLLAAAMPTLQVLGVDTNADAIEYAQQRAAIAGLPNARFQTADATALSGDGTALLVALHACGGLSDVALRLAASWGASCLICTCCFGKHRALSPAAEWDLPNGEEAKDVLCRMADCVDPSVSDEARRVVSCLRLQSLRRQMRPSSRVARASIRTFPSDYSRQNVVLCAACE